MIDLKEIYTIRLLLKQNPTSVKKTEEFVLNAETDNINYLLLPEKNSGIKKGYYVIATIYKDKNKATKYVSEFKDKKDYLKVEHLKQLVINGTMFT